MRKRQDHNTNTAFIDIICCGFGAVVLLLILLETGSIGTSEVLESGKDQGGLIRQLQQQLFDIRGQILDHKSQLNAKREQLSRYLKNLALLRGQRESLALQVSQSNAQKSERQRQISDLKLAVQMLTEEMKRLELLQDNSYIAGVPVDSEYIIFIIDTSGSMTSVAWQRVLREVNDILDVYPQVKGIQVMNDMGEYMFRHHTNSWLPDNVSMREKIITTLQNWHPFSNSSPVEGITYAIRTFYDPKKKISLYVFGDDFSGNINSVVQTIASLNKKSTSGESLVRIHTMGFPVGRVNGRFATLMRRLAEQNAGAFIGLNSTK